MVRKKEPKSNGPTVGIPGSAAPNPAKTTKKTPSAASKYRLIGVVAT